MKFVFSPAYIAPSSCYTLCGNTTHHGTLQLSRRNLYMKSRWTNFHCVKKLKPIGTAFSQNYYYLCKFLHLTKVKGDDGKILNHPVSIPLHRNYHV